MARDVRLFTRELTLASLALIVAASPVRAQGGQPLTTSHGEWPSYGGDPRGSRYSPLDQIGAANFSSLEVAWRFKTDSLGPRPEYKLESTPLVVGGVLYTTGGTNRAVVALDAVTGVQKWVHREDEGPRGAAAPRQLSGRGLAYWTDGREERVLYVTPGYRLIALDAKTGARIPSFGVEGAVDLKTDIDQTILPDLITGEIGFQGAPVVGRDVIVVGAAFREGTAPKSFKNNKGYVRGFDVRTGKRLWTFHTVPQKGEPGYDSWLNGSADYTGNTGVWSQVTIDEELGLVYLPVESPTGDYYGGHRPGNDLYGESLVCLDLRTGAKKWHYQIVHHPIWDFDIPAAPILADIKVDGKTIKAVAVPTKQGILYTFDRLTGKPVWPIEEKAVEKGEVPGEWYSPTQPMPTKPRGVRQERHIDGRLGRLHTGIARAGGGDRVALQARPDLHAARGQQGRRSARHAHARPDERRIELARRRVRSGDAHVLRRVVERGADRAGARAAEQGSLRHGLGARHRAAAERRARRPLGARVAALQAALRNDDGDQPRQGRDRVAGAARRDAGRGA